jgi:hypothetical protein
MHYNNRFKFNNSWFRYVYQSQFRTRAQNILYLRRKVRMGPSEHWFSHFFKDTGTVANGLAGTKRCVGEIPLHFPLELLRVYASPQLPLWRTEVGLYLENIVLVHIHWFKPFFLFRCVEFTPKLCPSNTDTPCICKTFLTLKCHPSPTHCIYVFRVVPRISTRGILTVGF